MKKKIKLDQNKLKLDVSRIRQLDHAELKAAAGGMPSFYNTSCGSFDCA